MKKFTKKCFMWITALMIASFLSACGSDSGSGSSSNLQISPDDVNLGLGSSIAVLGGTAGATNQGVGTVVIGDLVAAGASTMITGFHSSSFSYTETTLNRGAVTGSVYTYAPQGNAASSKFADQAIVDLTDTYEYLSTIKGGKTIAADQLGGKTITSGVYRADSGAFLLTGGNLTLDAKGNADAVWVFQMVSSLTVGDTAPRSVILANGAQAKNVYWAVGSAATINGIGGGTMVGTIISNTGGITFSTAGNATITKLDGRALSLLASVTMVNTSVNAYGVATAGLVLPDGKSHIILSGSHSGDISPTITGGGYITVNNNGGHVAATVTGTGSINASNNGVIDAALSATLTGSGKMYIMNNGGTLSATNTGDGDMSIKSTCTAAVSVTNMGDGKVTVIADGTAVVAISHTGDSDVIYHNNTDVTASTAAAQLLAPPWSITGINALDVSPTVTGSGIISVVNDGGHVAATVTGDGKLSIINSSVGNAVAATLTGNGSMVINNTLDGGVLAVTNTGNGAVNIQNACSAAVSVTNTGNGKVTVFATGSTPIEITHTGDDDYVYGSASTFDLSNITDISLISHISVTGSNPTGVVPTLTGQGYINVVNNGAGVTVTETGNGTVNIFNDIAASAMLTATNNSDNTMTISNFGSAALGVTCSSADSGATTVKNASSSAVTVTTNGTGKTTVNVSATCSGAVTVTNNSAYHLTVNATGVGGTVTKPNTDTADSTSSL
jgi:hypothetical protein